MKWQLYNKEKYSEIYFRGDTPRSLKEWETVVRANPKCVYWLSPDAFITRGYGNELTRATRAKKNFPRCYFHIRTNLLKDFSIWATTEMEAFRTLYEMTLYSDFVPSLEEFSYSEDGHIKLPTLLLKEVLKQVVNPLEFQSMQFQSEYAGRVLAQSGPSTKLTLVGCAFEPAAEEAFVDEMLSKTDKNSGLTGLHFLDHLPFRSEQNLVRLLMSEYGPMEFSYLWPDSRFSEDMLIGLRNSPGVQFLALCSENFADDGDKFGGFLSSLNSTTSTSLRKLTIHGWNFSRHVNFPMEIFQNLSLTHFCLREPTFDEASWKILLREIPKCATLVSLEFWHIDWWGSKECDDAEVEFAMEMTRFLKSNINIVSTNKKEFIVDDFDLFNEYKDEIVYTTYIAPILEHNRLIQNLKILRERANYQMRGFLVSEAVGTRFAGKVSSCYTVLKANVDVLVSYLSSRHLPRGKKRNICSLNN